MDISHYFKPISAAISPSKPAPSPLLTKTSQPPKLAPSRTPDSIPQPTQHRILPPELSIEPCTPTHLPSLKRINALILPIRYPEKFYTEILSSPETSSLTRVATWRPLPTTKRKHLPSKHTHTSNSKSADSVPTPTAEAQQECKVIGSIRCRLEHVPTSPNQPTQKEVYIQTLTLLAPYRGLGIGTALLDSIVREAVREHGATALYAHVWEKNQEALEWYAARGFEVGEVVHGYYRRLKPGGARIVSRRVGVGEALSITGEGEGLGADEKGERGCGDGVKDGKSNGDQV